MLPKLKRAVKRLLGRGQAADELPADCPAADRELIQEIRERKLTYLSNSKLASLASACRRLDECQIEGKIIEAGCALGGSTILLGRLKDQERPLEVYDVFGMIPPPTDEDPPEVHERYRIIAEGKSQGIGGDQYYGYVANLDEVVKQNLEEFGCGLEEHNIRLIKGLLQDTLSVESPVALAHVDVDWYEPVMTCLERIGPKLSVGGMIILDDYHDWGGCKQATDEFLGRNRASYESDDSAKSMKLIRSK